MNNENNIVVDISEIKTYRHCARQWALGSRNKMHLRPRVTPRALNFGTIFHACLHAMYNKNVIDLEAVRSMMDEEDFRIMENIVGNYVDQVLPADLERYEVLDTEFKFEEPINGSIDMIVREKATGKIYGVEHKSGKSFRAEIYNLLDEQPMIYSIAIEKYFGRCDGILLNEVKKLKTKLEQKRTRLTYTKEELEFFLEGVLRDKEAIIAARNNDITKFQACPDFAKCQMCDFQPLCLELRVDGDIRKVSPELLKTYDYIVKEQDHLLEEKEINLTL